MYKGEKHWVRAEIAQTSAMVHDPNETEAWLRISDIVGVYVVSGKTFAINSFGSHYQIHARVEDILEAGGFHDL